jgi:pimeloyl-ACP methyl ester carboxylesterase
MMAEWRLTQTYRFNGNAIRYDIQGDGPPVILVHGTPWSSFNLRHLIEGLSRDFTVHYFDLLGYGQSDKPDGNVSLGIQNQILDQLIDHWKLERPAIIGHDFGGATALRTHLLNRRDFQKIVLIDPVAISPWGSPFFQHVRKHEAAFAGVPDYIHEAIFRAYIQTAAFQPMDEDTLDRTLQPWGSAEGKAGFYRQIAQANSRYTDEVQTLYPQISRPTLILWGREDTWIPVDRGETLHGMIPDSQFYAVPESGHLVIEERPDRLLETIIPFLKEHSIC